MDIVELLLAGSTGRGCLQAVLIDGARIAGTVVMRRGSGSVPAPPR